MKATSEVSMDYLLIAQHDESTYQKNYKMEYNHSDQIHQKQSGLKSDSANAHLDMDLTDSRLVNLDTNLLGSRHTVPQNLRANQLCKESQIRANQMMIDQNQIIIQNLLPKIRPIDPRPNRNYCTKKIILRRVFFDFSGKENDKMEVDENVVDKDEELLAPEPGEELKTFRKKH